MIRVLVADGHPVVRSGLKAILTRQYHIATAGEAGTGPEVLQLVAKERWDVVVLDASLPDGNGLEIVKDIKRTRPTLPILILSAHPENELAMRALRAGASG